MNAIQELSPVHEAMLNWVLQNPEKDLRAMSAHFNYTMPWLSRVMCSDIFRAKLAERQDAVFACVADDIPRKLRALADVAIEKLGDKLERSEDPRFIRESFDSVMEHMGFKARPAGSFVFQQNNTSTAFVVGREDLARLRKTITGETFDSPALPAPVQASLEAPAGHMAVLSAPLYTPPTAEVGGETTGNSI